MKITIEEYDLAYRIIRQINFGVIELKNDVLIFNDKIELKKYDTGTWCVYKRADLESKYFPNLLEALESTIIGCFMEKLAIAIYDEQYYNHDGKSLNLTD